MIEVNCKIVIPHNLPSKGEIGLCSELIIFITSLYYLPQWFNSFFNSYATYVSSAEKFISLGNIPKILCFRRRLELENPLHLEKLDCFSRTYF